MPVDEHLSPLDLALGLTGRAVGVTFAMGRRVTAMTRAAAPAFRPLVRVAEQLPEPWRQEKWLQRVNREGAAYRQAMPNALAAVLDLLVPVVVDEVVSRARLTDVVLRYVDLDRIVAAVDLNRAVSKVDVNQVVAMVDLDSAVHRVDIDAVVSQVDLDAIVDRIDVDAIVSRVDVDAIVSRVDVDAIAGRLDVDQVLDRMDLTSVVLTRVDLDALVTAILGHIDMIGLAEEIIDGVDLSEIIRESTGTMASDTVQGVRMQGILADDAISHAMDRLLLRRRRRGTEAPSEQPVPGAAGELPVPGTAGELPEESRGEPRSDVATGPSGEGSGRP
jgi:hypothetical protein